MNTNTPKINNIKKEGIDSHIEWPNQKPKSPKLSSSMMMRMPILDMECRRWVSLRLWRVSMGPMPLVNNISRLRKGSSRLEARRRILGNCSIWWRRRGKNVGSKIRGLTWRILRGSHLKAHPSRPNYLQSTSPDKKTTKENKSSSTSSPT